MRSHDKLLALRKNIEALNAATEQLNQMLTEAEKSLDGVAIEAWIEINGGRFGYRKIGKDWCLAFEPTGASVQALSHASRAVRIEALTHFNDLVDALDARACDLIAKMTTLTQESKS